MRTPLHHTLEFEECACGRAIGSQKQCSLLSARARRIPSASQLGHRSQGKGAEAREGPSEGVEVSGSAEGGADDALIFT